MAEAAVVDAPAPAAPAAPAAAPAVAPTAPVAPAPAAVPAPAGQEDGQPKMTRASLEMRAAERARGTYKATVDAIAKMKDGEGAPAEVPTGEKPRDEKGRFATADPAKADATKPGAADTPPPEGAKAPTEVPSIPATEKTPERLTVEIQDGHPLKARRAAFTASDEDEARDLRGLLNSTGTRVRELEQERTARLAAEKRADEMHARLISKDAEAAAEHEFQATPAYQAAVDRYHELKALEDSGDLKEGTAKEFWDATTGPAYQKFKDAKVTERMGEVRAEQEARLERDWVQSVYSKVDEYPDELRALPGFGGWVDKAMAEFYALFDNKLIAQEVKPGDGEALNAAFQTYFRDSHLKHQPSFQQLLRKWHTEEQAAKTPAAPAVAPAQQAMDRAEIERQAVDKFRKGAQDTRTAMPPNPVAQLSHGSRPAGASTPVNDQPIKAANQFELQQGANQRAGSRAARWFGRK